MSIYKQIFATASVFAIAASALISPSVNAAVINNTTLPSGHILCALKSGNNTSSAIALASVVGTLQGESYTVHLVNSSSCGLITGTPGTSGNASAGISTFVFDTHATQLNISSLAAGTSTTPPTLVGTATYENNIPKYTGPTTVNICLGVSKEYEIKFEDTPDNDFLEEAGAIQTSLGNNAFVRSVSANGSLTYFIKPTTQAFSTLNNTFTFTPAVREQANSNRNTAVIGNNYGSTVSTPVVTFKTVDTANCPTTTVSSSSMSSSSMMMSSSSMMMSSSSVVAPVASAMAATSSKATVTIEEPATSGKGGSTVRTGGAY